MLAAALAYIVIRNAAAPRASETAPVVLAAQEIPSGATIQPGMVTKENRKPPFPGGVFSDETAVIGQVAITTVPKDTIVTESQVRMRNATLGLAYVVPEGMRAVTVALDQVIGVAGFLKSGDHVDVVATFHLNNGSVTKTILQDMTLLAVGSQVQQTTLDTKGGRAKAEPQQTATFVADPRDAEKLILAESKGRLRLILRRQGDIVRVPTPGITSRALIGFVPSDAGTTRAEVAISRPTYGPPPGAIIGPFGGPRGSLPPGTGPMELVPRREIEVIKGTQIERVPVRT